MKQIYKPKMATVLFVGLSCVVVATGLMSISNLRDQSILALLSTIPFALGIFLLGSVLKNQIIEVLDDGVVVHSFRKRVKLDINDLHEIVTRRNGYISFCFQSDKGWFRITPLCYHLGEMLQDEFNRLFGLSRPKETEESKSQNQRVDPTRTTPVG